MPERLDSHALDQLFRAARTRNAWTDRPVSEADIRELYELMKMGPTSANSCPARFVWVRSQAGKAQLAACAGDQNKEKILSAPVTAIIGFELEFAREFATLF